LVPKHCR